MVGQLVASQFQTAQNWALGSAMAVLLMIVIMLTIAVAGLIIWLITWPSRSRNTLVLGDADEKATDATPAARTEVLT
jgi:spermidine/putrescine transport system permease protein